MKSLRILYLSQRLPYPPDSGDRIPVFHHLRLLAQRHVLTVGSLVEGAEEQRHAEALQNLLGPRGRVWTRAQPWWLRVLGMAEALLRREPLSLGYFRNRSLASAVRRGIEAGDFDVVIVFSSTMAPYVEPFDGVARIMNFCDVDSRKWADLAAHAGWLEGRVFRREARLLARYERHVAARFRRACFVTAAEAALFRDIAPQSAPEVVPNGVDLVHFSRLQHRPKARSIAFVGVMDYVPNVDAVLYFANEVFPALRARFPDCRFTIVGSRPRRAVRALARRPGIRVTGYVDDVRIAMAESSLIVAPLAVARGVQNKVLEAAAAGIPVMTTPVVAACLPEELRTSLMVHPREPLRWIDAIATFFGDPEPETMRVAAARAVVERDFTWESAVALLEGLVMDAVTNQAGPAGIHVTTRR
jgi:sugar transferase (PEP-CTERM/EpsH1 system associated)